MAVMIAFVSLVSSAKDLPKQCFITSYISLIKMINNNGPSTVPCGTPLTHLELGGRATLFLLQSQLELFLKGSI